MNDMVSEVRGWFAAAQAVQGDTVALRRGTREVAQAYLGYLYSKEGQEIIAKNFYRPRDAEVAARYAQQFPQLRLATIADFGGWSQAQRIHFKDGGVFDQITAPP